MKLAFLLASLFYAATTQAMFIPAGTHQAHYQKIRIVNETEFRLTFWTKQRLAPTIRNRADLIDCPPSEILLPHQNVELKCLAELITEAQNHYTTVDSKITFSLELDDTRTIQEAMQVPLDSSLSIVKVLMLNGSLHFQKTLER
jgi:hypothetical protein